ncbi:MAG TPA: NUDIX hydrolase [Thermaerobacter sp.]
MSFEPPVPGKETAAEVECPCLEGGTRRFPARAVRFRPAVYGVAVRDGRVLLGRSVFTGLLDIPGGAVEPWELLEQGLRREFREETGVEPEPLELVHFSESFFAIYGHPFHSLRFYFLVRVPEDATFTPQRTEITDLEWIDIGAVPETQFAPGDLEILRKALERASRWERR